jgi:hippurate hydrolase
MLPLLPTTDPNLLPWMTHHRRELHANPEVGLSLPDTHDYLEAALVGLGLAPEVRPGAGLTVRISGTSDSHKVRILRADMDALAVEEVTDLPFASSRPGAMHACGHDFHMAILLGVAKTLQERPPVHDVILAFQPGEESDRGALRTLTHKNLQDLEDATAFALHVHATLPAHTVNYRYGTFMAHGDWFRVAFQGPGGHASSPHLTGNPVDAAAHFVTALHALAQDLSAGGRLVATVTEVLMGNTVNVIPTEGSLRGTIRTLDAEQRGLLLREMEQIAVRAGRQARVLAKLTVTEGYPAVVSDDNYLRSFLEQLLRSSLADALHEMDEPSMVIEDFAYFLKRWPGAMVYLGANVDGATAFNHSADVVFDERVMSTGVELHLQAIAPQV